MLGGTHEFLRLLDVERIAIFEECGLVLSRVVVNADSGFGGVTNDLVVHVGDVHDVVEGMAAKAQKAAEKVHSYEGAEIADVAVVVNCGSAGIEADGTVLGRAELFDIAGKSVVKAQRHRILDCNEH